MSHFNRQTFWMAHCENGDATKRLDGMKLCVRMRTTLELDGTFDLCYWSFASSLVWIIQAGDAFIIWYRFGSVIGIVALASFVSNFFLFPRVLFFVNQIAYSFRAFALWFYLQWKHYHSICNNSHWTNGIRWIKWLASIERCHRMSNTDRYYRSIRNACCTQVLSMWKCIE